MTQLHAFQYTAFPSAKFNKKESFTQKATIFLIILKRCVLLPFSVFLKQDIESESCVKLALRLAENHMKKLEKI